MNCRNEYTKELFRVILKYKWKSNTEINSLIEETNETPEGLWHKLLKSCGKMIKEEQLLEIIQKREKEKIDPIRKAITDLEEIQNQIQFQKWKKSKVNFSRHLEDKNINSKQLINVWKQLNIKKEAFIEIIKMQEESMFTGSKRAKILKNEEEKYCKHCERTVCTISHILIGCPVSRKLQIQRHDEICKELYLSIMRKYSNNNQNVNTNLIPKCTRLEENDVTILFNKDVIPHIHEYYARRPDVFVQVKQEEAFIFDVSIVKEENMLAGYSQKITKYRRLQEIVRSDFGVRKVIIVPLIISIHGFVYCHSFNMLKSLKVNFNWEKVIRSLIINEMKDVKFYLNQRIDDAEIGIENPILSHHSEAHNEDVSGNE